MEARRGETGAARLDAQHDSPAPKGRRPEHQSRADAPQYSPADLQQARQCDCGWPDRCHAESKAHSAWHRQHFVALARGRRQFLRWRMLRQELVNAVIARKGLFDVSDRHLARIQQPHHFILPS